MSNTPGDDVVNIQAPAIINASTTLATVYIPLAYCLCNIIPSRAVISIRSNDIPQWVVFSAIVQCFARHATELWVFSMCRVVKVLAAFQALIDRLMALLRLPKTSHGTVEKFLVQLLWSKGHSAFEADTVFEITSTRRAISRCLPFACQAAILGFGIVSLACKGCSAILADKGDGAVVSLGPTSRAHSYTCCLARLHIERLVAMFADYLCSRRITGVYGNTTQFHSPIIAGM